ncbi:unnamed protein product [Amoebophrya sp. A120]|nr:unnamed protein product [Amoebophrya sp. A120]|eukprot:GSA120T00015184001.1
MAAKSTLGDSDPDKVNVGAVKSALEVWAHQRRDEAVALKKEVQDLKKKKFMMLAMLKTKSPGGGSTRQN